MGGFLKEFLTYDLLRTMCTELFKAILTFLFAYVSFRFFQDYKEKKQNNKIYIKMLKLKDNIKRNIKKIDDMINLYKEGEKLQKELKLNSSMEKYHYDIAKNIKEIINFYLIDETYIDFYDQLVEKSSFNRYPIEYIKDISNEIEYINKVSGTERELEIQQYELDMLKQKDIMKDLQELYKVIIQADKAEKFKYISNRLQEFNKKEITIREKEIDRFCKEIFQQNEKVTGLLEKYNRYDELVYRILENTKKEEVVITFKEIEDKEEVLASNDAEFYFEIETFIDKYNNSKILIDNREKLNNTNQELEKFKAKLDTKIVVVKKRIDSTKLFF